MKKQVVSVQLLRGEQTHTRKNRRKRSRKQPEDEDDEDEDEDLSRLKPEQTEQI